MLTNAFYFGPEQAELFGIYHPPQSRDQFNYGAVLCYPTGQEYLRSHRAFRLLANDIQNRGIPLLRFDYYGCGDSAGSNKDGHFEHWLADVDIAIEKIKELAGIRKVILVGLRMGGTLAFMAAQKRRDVHGVVLWEPIIRGVEYIDALKKSLNDWLTQEFSSKLENPFNHEWLEQYSTLDYPISEKNLLAISSLNLAEVAAPVCRKILLIRNFECADDNVFMERIKKQGGGVEYLHVGMEKVWVESDEERIVVPQPIIKKICTWILDIVQ